MSVNKDSTSRALKRLFAKAKEVSFYEYLYTLVRVAGLSNGPDPLTSQDSASIIADDEAVRELFGVLFNLLRVTAGETYQRRSFTLPAPGSPFGFERIPMPDADIERALLGEAAKSRQRVIPNLIRDAFQSADARNHFLAAILTEYQNARRAMARSSHLFAAPDLAVGQFLANDAIGVYGFHFFWPDGGESYFKRTEQGTDACNIRSDPHVQIIQNGPGVPWEERMYKGKPLYETGLPGRYNRRGCWKPIVYQGNADKYVALAKAQTKDEDVQACLFYIMSTGHRCIEFAVRTPITFTPAQLRQFTPIELILCKTTKKDTGPTANEAVYDGTVYLSDIAADTIGNILDDLQKVFSKLAFVFQKDIRWCLKYSLYAPPWSRYVVQSSDMAYVRRVFRHPISLEDSIVLDAAMQWHNFGAHSESPFTAIVAQTIALETVANAISHGRASYGLSAHFAEISPDEQEACIQRLDTDIESRAEFIRTAYSECLPGVIVTMKSLFRAVYGEHHPFYTAMFKRVKDNKDAATCALYSLRSKIAHGELSPSSSADRRTVRERVPALHEIATDCLTRLALGLSRRQKVPIRTWKETRTLLLADPRATRNVSHHDVLEERDWQIRGEWIV